MLCNGVFFFPMKRWRGTQSSSVSLPAAYSKAVILYRTLQRLLPKALVMLGQRRPNSTTSCAAQELLPSKQTKTLQVTTIIALHQKKFQGETLFCEDIDKSPGRH